MSSVIAVAKVVTGVAVTSGVGTIVGTIIRNNVAMPAHILGKIAHVAGTAALGGYVSAKVGEFLDEEIDRAVEGAQNIKTAWTEARDIVKENKDPKDS